MIMKQLKELRQHLKQVFKQNEIPLDEVDKILCEVLKIDYSKLFLCEKISTLNTFKLNKIVKKRLSGKPLTKIFKQAYFYGLKFNVNKNVLSPRQETELLVTEALKVLNTDGKVLDVCTGSGAIAVAIKANCACQVDALDISKKAIKTAKQNAKLNNVNINFFQSNMFEKVNDKYNVIVSNPPYIATKTVKQLPVEVKDYDPKLALDGGDDGLKFYKILASESPKFLENGGYLILEIGFDQRESVECLLNSNNFDTICLKDYSQNDRVIIGKLKKV